METNDPNTAAKSARSPPSTKCWSPFQSIKFFVFCQCMLQLGLLLVSGCLKSGITTIERRYGFSSKKVGLLSSFNEVGNTVLIVFVSFFGSRVHRPRFIGGGALLTSVATLIMAIPHFTSEPYQYSSNSTVDNSSGLCHSEGTFTELPSSQSCTQRQTPSHQGVYPLLLLGQLLRGIGTVPVQPFGMSYIDDHASKRNSPLYLGLSLAANSIGSAFGFIVASVTLRFYVDFDKIPSDQIELDPKDLRWVGAWWLGLLATSCFLFLCSLPYFFFPRHMSKEVAAGEKHTESEDKKSQDLVQQLTLIQFIKAFPRVVLRMMRNPIYLLVVLAQVFLAGLVAGIATFMAKFTEQQFTLTASFANMLIGAVAIPLAVMGTILGGIVMRRMSLSVMSASKMCSTAVFLCLITGLPLIFIGCSTQRIAGVFPPNRDALACSAGCMCPQDDFNPVCGSDGVEFVSPCVAGCVAMETGNTNHKVQNYTLCQCVGGGGEGGGGGGGGDGDGGSALPGTCGSRCSHLLFPFLVLSGLTLFIGSLCKTPSFMMVLRTVTPEDKSFAVGIEFMLFRVLAFFTAPVVYGSVIDTTCILWNRKCGKRASCRYYDLDHFRQRMMGLQCGFISGGLVCFLISLLVLQRQKGSRGQKAGSGRGYQLVIGESSPECSPENSPTTEPLTLNVNASGGKVC